MQDTLPLADGRQATICTIRDPVGAAILMARAFDVTDGDRTRRLTWQEVREVIRSTCSRWATLPDAIQTDHEVCLGGHPTDPAPGRLTLWLVGLGVRHVFIRPHTPTDQAHVERSHRTLDGFVGLPDPRLDVAELQHRLDTERDLHNQVFASRARDCSGRPPLVAHPELLHARRPYRLEWERQLFDEQRVYAYVATIPLTRKVSCTGQLTLGGKVYSVGRRYRHHLVTVQGDAMTREWVVSVAEGTVVKRMPMLEMDSTTLTGIPDNPTAQLPPIQLTLPLAA
jgi:hypothetical protein